MLTAFLRWWAERLSELVPSRIWRVTAAAGPSIVVAVDATEARVLRRRGGVETLLVRFFLDAPAPPKGLRIREAALRLPPGFLLEQPVTLPLAAARDPRQVLHYEMDRLTPFAPDEVFWSCTPVGIDRTARQLTLLLSLVPKAPLQSLLAALARAGLRPTTLEAAREDGAVRRIALGMPSILRTRLLARAEAGLAIACAALAVAAIALPFVQQARSLADVDARIAALRPLVAQAEAARTHLAIEAGTAGAIAAERARVGDALQALAAITNVLPDDTFLTDLTLRARKLTIGGRSEAAVKLIPALAADRTIGNPAFLTPVTRANAGHPDVFSIAAEVRP